MNWTKWSSIAEIISSIAILATLMVLILEVRGNTDEIRAASATTVSGRTVDLIYEMNSNPMYVEAFSIFAEGGELTFVQGQVLLSYLGPTLKLTEESFIAYRAGRLSEEVWLTRAKLALDVFSGTEETQREWITKRDSGWYVQDFADWFDAELAKRIEE